MTPLLGEELECDRAVETGISRAVHQTHAPTAEPFDDVVVGYRLTDHPSSNQSPCPLWSDVEFVPSTAQSLIPA